MLRLMARALAGILLMALTGLSVAATFSNATTITSPVGAGTSGTGPGIPYSPYPSAITVSGMTGTISKVTVTINNLSVDRPDDMAMVLVSPNGANLVIISDLGGTTAAANTTLTLDDAAASQLPDNGSLVSGTFKPTAVNSGIVKDNFPAPGPGAGVALTFAAPSGAGTFASQFNGTNPNGTWNLYIIDDALGPASGIGGVISGGWSIAITTAVATAPTATVITSSLNPSFTTAPSNTVTFTATVGSAGNPVTQGTVTFMEGAATLQAATAVNGSGQAAFTTSALSEGSHPIKAIYNGTASFATSNSTLTQVVNNHTIVTGSAFCNPGPIAIPDGALTGGPATPYPSNIFVSGLTGAVSKVTLTLNNLTDTRPDDLDMLLVGPNGAKFVVMSDVGGQTAVGNITLTLDDAAASLLPDATPLTTGAFRPTAVNFGSGAMFPAPAPGAPYSFAQPFGAATFATSFGGSNPNGTWSLYVVDDATGGGAGSIASACLSFITSSDAPTTTTVTSSQNPSFTSSPNNTVTFTAHVARTSDSSNVTLGTVTFKEGATVLAGPVTLNGSGTASFTAAALPEGVHVITAVYNGSAGNFNISNGSVTQTVDNHTTVSGNTFCNAGPLAINSSGMATPYPSRIFVSGLASSISKVTLTLNNLNHNRPDDIDLLLVGPTGAQVVTLSDVGGTSAASNVTLTLDDAAGSLVPDNGPLASGVFRPTSVNFAGASVFPAPAPAAPYNFAAPSGAATLGSAFNGTDPNGPWSLYVVNDGLGASGNFAGGACLTINATTPPPLSALITGKTGAQNARAWTVTLANSGPGTAGNAQINGLALTQTFGPACTPVVTSPASFPLPVGTIPAGGSASGNVGIDFTGCTVTSRFSATIPFSSNGGLSTGSKILNNQFR